MVKIIERDRTRENKLSEKIKELNRVTSKILSGEKITYSKKGFESISCPFVVGDIPKESFKALVQGLERRIVVYDRKFFPTAKRLAEEYEAITKKGVPRGYYLRGKWSLEKEFRN